MDSTRLKPQAREKLDKIKNELFIRTNKKANEFVILDYDRLLDENKKLKDKLKAQELMLLVS